MLSISYEKKIQNKIGMRHEFFSCEKRVWNDKLNLSKLG